MNRKIYPINWFLAVVVSIVVIPALILSVFVLPVEMILFNQESYTEFLENEEYIAQMPPVISDVATQQVLLAGEVPQVLGKKSNFQTVLVDYLPSSWVKNVTAELLYNTLDYFNFKTPYPSISLEIADLKDAIAVNSNSIANEYVNSLESCQGKDVVPSSEGTELAAYPQCKPDAAQRAELTQKIGTYLEDRAANLPNAISLTGLIPENLAFGERAFYWYSVCRWVFRLLPFATILLLMVAALLLKKNKKVMRGWIGWILAGVTGVLLIAALVLLVGLEQFIGLLLNRQFSLLVGGFGNILLGIVQSVSNRIILWVIATSGIILLFGLILILAARYTRIASSVADQESEMFDADEVKDEKSIVPQTLEEVEEEEQNNNNNK